MDPLDEVWLPRIGLRAIRQRALANRIVFIGILLGGGVAVSAVLTMAKALPPGAHGLALAYDAAFGVYGALMVPCGWLPMYLAAGRSAARFLGPQRTARRRIPIAWLRDPALFDRQVANEYKEYAEGAGPLPYEPFPYPKIPDPRHEALVAKLKERQEQRRPRDSERGTGGS